MNSNPSDRRSYGSRASVVDEVVAERERQDAKWGEQNHPPEWWLAILMEEVGEAAKAALGAWSMMPDAPHIAQRHLKDYRKETVEAAAVAIAAIECFDRLLSAGAEGEP